MLCDNSTQLVVAGVSVGDMKGLVRVRKGKWRILCNEGLDSFKGLLMGRSPNTVGQFTPQVSERSKEVGQMRPHVTVVVD